MTYQEKIFSRFKEIVKILKNQLAEVTILEVSKTEVHYRERDFDTAECEYCRYFGKNEICKVLTIKVGKDWVCDAYQGAPGKFKSYKVKASDIPAFAKGMVVLQPYKHIVVKGLSTPVGFLLIVKDTMKPKPHIFSLDMGFSIEHTSREHHWTQAEVNKIIQAGKK